MSNYDPNNIFAKILRGEIPSNPLLDTEYVLAFNDIQPQAPVHVLIIPKGAYTDMTDFSRRGSAEEKAALVSAVAELVDQFGLEENGYRLISNCKSHGGQEVPHLHWHILGGEPIGPLRARI